MIAVGTQDHELTVNDQVAEGVGAMATINQTGPHGFDRFDVPRIHAGQDIAGESAQEIAPGTRSQHQTFRLALHGAVVSQGCWIQTNAVEPDFSCDHCTNAPPNRLGIKAAIKEGIAHQTLMLEAQINRFNTLKTNQHGVCRQ